MKKKIINETKNREKKLPGYMPYPEDEDIYSKFKEEAMDPEEIVEGVSITGKIEPSNRMINSVPGVSELDIPGSELDDDTEALGNEDEENNYYSLGGENHEDLENDK